MDKSLKNKAIDIKGKKYVLVSDRVLFFNEEYPAGSITTEIVSNDEVIVIKATVTPDVTIPSRFFSAYSQATKGDGYINKTSALENAETSAVGRALAFMGIGVIESIASVDEINKANNTGKIAPYPTRKTATPAYKAKDSYQKGRDAAEHDLPTIDAEAELNDFLSHES